MEALVKMALSDAPEFWNMVNAMDPEALDDDLTYKIPDSTEGFGTYENRRNVARAIAAESRSMGARAAVYELMDESYGRALKSLTMTTLSSGEPATDLVRELICHAQTIVNMKHDMGFLDLDGKMARHRTLEEF